MSEEESLSDYKQLMYWLAFDKPELLMKRSPRNTNWDAFKEEVRGRLRKFPTKYGTIDELELSAPGGPQDQNQETVQ